MKLRKIFKKEHGIIIGAIHFPPLLGYPDFPGMKAASRNALQDLKAFSRGGADGVIFENNYDIPHTVEADSGTVASMAYLGAEIMRSASIPVGVNVLWNDFKTGLVLAKILNLSFIRIPVFVDTVKTNCGVIKGNAREVVAFRKKIKAERVALFTDIHVKHSKLLSRYSIIESARRAIKAGSDGLIVTGKWTGDAPSIDELARVRRVVGKFPILVGSGADEKNINTLLRYANGVIVGTSLKQGNARKGEVNVKTYKQRISEKKIRQFVATVDK
ncbi:MAG: BtpA/SgcQ family protein [Candidatus Jorgensenbacteria bacterium]